MNESLLNRILKDHKRRTRSLALILCLSMIVSLGTFAGFHQTAIAKVYTREVLDCPYTYEGAEPVAHVHNDDCYEGETLVCTLPEREAHTHDDTCYAESRLLNCGLEENPGHQHTEACFDENGELICQIPEGEGAHSHTEKCYTIERALVCNQPELPVHVHDAGCFRTEEITVDEPEEAIETEQTVSSVPEMPVSDPNADLETSDDWNREFENLELSGNWARDLVLVAATQQGRGESPNNFEAILNDAGDAWVKRGYTRYGAWYGVPYAEEWSAMFVSFCLRYAGIPVENVPNNPTAAFMAESFSNGELFVGRDYVPAVGDLIFFDTVNDEITNIDHMGIVYHVDAANGTINTVEGDRTDAVATFGYYLNDEQIVGYGILPQNPNYISTEEENTDITDEAFDGFIFMTTDEEEEPEETPAAEDVTAAAVPMPAQSWERTAGGIKVSVEAPEGAFPENTTIAVTPVNGSSLKDTVSDAVSGEVLEVQAVDITFFDADGNEIEPAIPIRVTMTPAATQHAEEKTSVVHVDIAQQTAELIEQAVGTEFDNSEVVFDAEAFTIYAIVYTVDFEYEVNGTTYTASIPGAKDILLSEVFQELDIKTEETAESAAPVAEEAESPAETETDSEQEQEEKLENPATKEFTAAPSAFKDRITAVSSSNIDILTVTETENDWLIRVLKNTDTPEKLLVTLQDETTLEITVEAQGVTEVSTEDNSAVISTVNDLFLPESASAYATILTEEESTSAIAAVQATEDMAAPEAQSAEELSSASPDKAPAELVSDVAEARKSEEAPLFAAALEAESVAAGDTVYQVFDIGLNDVDPADYSDGFQVTLQLPEALTGRDFHLYHLHDGLVEEIKLNTVAETLEDGTELVSAVSFVTPSFSEFVLSYRQLHATLISAGGETWEITVTYDESAAIPDNATLQVREILPEDEGYQGYYQKSMEKAGVTAPETDDAEAATAGEMLSEPEEAAESTDTSEKATGPEEATQGSAKKVKSEYIRIFDIEIWADEQPIEPAAPVTVSIRLLDAPQESGAVPQVLHFAKEGEELMELKEQATRSENGKILFTTDEFSVYSVMYTVDFLYEIDGKVYSFAMQGADSVSLRALVETLHVFEKNDEEGQKQEGEEEKPQRISEAAKEKPELLGAEITEEQDRAENRELDAFMKDIVSVTFSNTDLLVPVKVEKTGPVGRIKSELGLFPTYPLGLKQAEVLALNAKEYTAGDWVLISMKAFSTEETLTIGMNTGESFEILVTDAQDAVMVGDRVQTISNPAGTTIDLFDYWIVSQNLVGRDGWGDLNQSQGAAEAGDDKPLNGTGNNKGINSSTSDSEHGHALKFSPAWSGTVYNGNKIGTTGNAWQSVNLDTRDGLNSYTGDEYTWHWNCPNPFTGIVQNNLYNGYPILTYNQTIGTTGESLAYLFDPNISHDGKASYSGTNQLLYVDRDGYYTYDSRDYAAAFDTGSKTFTLTEQTSNNSEIRGFWPFGTQNFWTGMHVNTQFSMPNGGQVLNPSGVLKPMQFEFSGDDDVWIYVDGILVGDAGGIHNRTEVDINFQTGKVSISGQDDKYLDDLFRTGLQDQGKTEAEIEEYITQNFDEHTFKAGTYHTFDFFYLERGGGESNLYIHYNLVSTADFTAHKAYYGEDETDILKRDQFQFELIGLDGKYRSVKNNETGNYELVQKDTTSDAIMPHASGSGEGTVASPHYEDNVSTTLSNGGTVNSQVYITGVTEDGNINFGSAVISETDMNEADQGNPPVYRYIIREVVPDDAMNAYGVTWAAATDEQKSAGGFVKDQVTYDGTVYYMTGRVTSWTETNASGQEIVRHGISKTYYTDDTYTTVKNDVSFASFENRFTPDYGSADFTKVDGAGHTLQGAVFTLYKDEACTVQATDLDAEGNPVWTATSDSNGKVSFENVRVGTYYMKETTAPENYVLSEIIYKVVVEDEKDTSKTSRITILGDESGTIVDSVANAKSGEITVLKKWLNVAGTEVDGGSNTAKVKLKRYKQVVESSNVETHTVTIKLAIKDYSGNSWTETAEKSFRGDHVTVEWTVVDGANNNVFTGQDSSYWDESSRITVFSKSFSEVSSDITLNVILNEYWPMQNGKFNIDSFSIAQEEPDEPIVNIVADDDFDPDSITLNSSSSWSHTWNIGGTESSHSGFDFPAMGDNGKNYLYYVVELDAQGNAIAVGGSPLEGYVLKGYSANNNTGVSNQGVITVYNQSENVNTINVVVRKTDNVENSTNYLDGAVFKLMYRSNSTGIFTNVSNESVPELDSKSQFTVPTAGITLTGLVDGQYQLQEVSPPSGYIITNSTPVIFTVSGGAITSTEGSTTDIRYTAATGDNCAEFTIPNTPGAALPQTGGIGTAFFTALGGLMTTTAGAILTIRQRKRIQSA